MIRVERRLYGQSNDKFNEYGEDSFIFIVDNRSLQGDHQGRNPKTQLAED